MVHMVLKRLILMLMFMFNILADAETCAEDAAELADLRYALELELELELEPIACRTCTARALARREAESREKERERHGERTHV